jgi:glyceraldehyde 3-phosphate dehydrogenase
MSTKIAINGFGRIGRLFYRALLEKDFLNGQVDVVAVNDLVPADNLAYLLKYDTEQGNLDADVRVEGDEIVVGDKDSFKVMSEKKHPSELNWGEHDIDVVIESTGLFRKEKDARGHIEAGAGKVIITAPSEEHVRTIVMGVNEGTYEDDDIVSNASCTTNCITPLVHVLMQSGIGIEEGIMTTIHSYTSTQSIVDGVNPKDPRKGRAAAENVIPTSTGAAAAVGYAIPELQGKLTGMAFRVPTATVSVVDLTVRTKQETSLEEINAKMEEASESYLEGILGYTEEPVVSSDFVHDPRSSIYDATAGIELNNKFFKLISWYDNEWGYSNRIVDLLERISG